MSKPLGSYDEYLLIRAGQTYGIWVEWATRRERMALQRLERAGLVERIGILRNSWTITQAGQCALDTKEYPDAS